ncbi:HAAS signaling domain-containing protein [Paenibacillus paeoniae]|uniref:Uncharacterized protein n=1 Tax=Paenibacillus paeoniae TaxID=2292705 RepID=A0A371PGR0_9BACL|nr:hypothetical protein [Paenibacillus paeoniae]REK75141.1 hypothetical protein DX130_16035 [Paenibacillus paeoniae]
MELVARYVHAVISKLPSEQRDEIEKELHGLIEDMLEERTGLDSRSADAEQIEAVLIELGSPAELAAKYNGGGRYLIGPGLFDTYIRVLKVVGMAIFIAMSVVLMIGLLKPDGTDVAVSFGSIFTSWIGSLIEAGMQGFVWVTVIFGLLEYKGIREDGLSSGKKAWRPSDLAPIPHSELQIKRLEPVFSIIFTVLFGIVLISSPEWISIYVSYYYSHPIPIFDVEILASYAPLIWGCIALVVLRESPKFVSGKWSKQLMTSHIIINVLLFIAALVMFSDGTIWNEQLTVQLQGIAEQLANGKDFNTVLSMWNNVTSYFIYLIVLIFLFELVLFLFKVYKLRKYL